MHVMPYSSPAEAFNIVVLYERSALLSRAMATCAHLRRELGNAFTLDFRIWRIDVATSRECAAQFDREIATADVIVIGVSGNEPCPPEFRAWKERAVDGSGGPHRAIIAIVDTAAESATTGETWNSVLRSGATQIHPEIFVWEPAEEDGAAGAAPSEDELEPVAAGG